MDDVVHQENMLCPIILGLICSCKNPQIERFYVCTGWRNILIFDFTVWKNMLIIWAILCFHRVEEHHNL